MAGTGGARPGAGRRTKAEILGLAKTLEQCVTKEDEKKMWAVIKQQAINGSIQHAQLYFGYKYGKPSEHIINEQDTEMIVRIIRNGTDHQPENPAPESAEGTTEPKEV